MAGEKAGALSRGSDGRESPGRMAAGQRAQLLSACTGKKNVNQRSRLLLEG